MNVGKIPREKCRCNIGYKWAMYCWIRKKEWNDKEERHQDDLTYIWSYVFFLFCISHIFVENTLQPIRILSISNHKWKINLENNVKTIGVQIIKTFQHFTINKLIWIASIYWEVVKIKNIHFHKWKTFRAYKGTSEKQGKINNRKSCTYFIWFLVILNVAVHVF